MSEPTEAEKEAELERAVGNILKGCTAVEAWQKAHGVVFDKPIQIACPNCSTEDALKFVQTRVHLYAECSTPKCLPPFRGSCRGRRWPK